MITVQSFPILDDRFWSKVEKTSTCWIWKAYLSRKGYGSFKINRKVIPAHKISYESQHGKVSSGLELDHLCRNRACVNPDHLEAVTHQENIRRGNSGIYQRSKTHCKRGHEFTKENTYLRPNKSGRECLTCKLISRAEYYKKHKGETKN